MKLLNAAILLVLCSSTQALTFSTISAVSLALISLNKPVSGFFGIFRRRKTPPIQETMAPPPPEFFPNGHMSGGMFNQFSGFGPGGGMFVPGLNNPQFGMFGNQFPPQFRPPMPPPRLPATPPMHQGFPPQSMQQHGMQQFPPQMPPMNMPQGMGGFEDSQGDEESPGMNTEEAESFFTLLSETDESKCISRLVCEMGANPANGGEFGQSIVEIIGSLKDFPTGSKVSEYNEVLNIGLAEGLSACLSKFSVCDDESFNLVKKAQLEDERQNT